MALVELAAWKAMRTVEAGKELSVRVEGSQMRSWCLWFKEWNMVCTHLPVRFIRDNRASHNVQQVKSEDERIVLAGKGIPYSLPCFSLPSLP